MEEQKELITEIKLPELSLVFLIGVSGSGKSSFARKHFKHTQIVSSDICRGIVSDDENNQSSTKDAFELLNYIVSMRLKNGLMTVIDATNLRSQDRKGLINIARKYHCLPVAIILNIPKDICQLRNESREDRAFNKHVIRSQFSTMRQGLRGLKREGFRNITHLRSVEEVDAIEKISLQPMYNNRKELTGPFDLIGDIHGCYDELVELITKLSYQIDNHNATHPENRTLIFLGDLNDRGPKTPDVYKLAMNMVAAGNALCVLGNHDFKLLKYLRGSKVKVNHGLEQTIEQLSHESDEFIAQLKEFLSSLISHYVLDEGKLVVAHAGLKEEMHGRGSGAVRSFCMYGETTGEIDQFGLPVRHNWAAEYKGRTKILYGHTP
ncbi:MAG TPA: polynucleotide kinase-phosphatase, partial [Oceanospirillales bacterium]|nr:polynucleotide kinase-phosphatase [Oceanospirillales bacterium]